MAPERTVKLPVPRRRSACNGQPEEPSRTVSAPRVEGASDARRSLNADPVDPVSCPCHRSGNRNGPAPGRRRSNATVVFTSSRGPCNRPRADRWPCKGRGVTADRRARGSEVNAKPAFSAPSCGAPFCQLTGSCAAARRTGLLKRSRAMTPEAFDQDALRSHRCTTRLRSWANSSDSAGDAREPLAKSAPEMSDVSPRVCFRAGHRCQSDGARLSSRLRRSICSSIVPSTFRRSPGEVSRAV